MTWLFGTLFRVSVVAPSTLLMMLGFFSLLLIFKPTRWYVIGAFIGCLYI